MWLQSPLNKKRAKLVSLNMSWKESRTMERIIVISEGGTQAFQSNSAVNGLVQLHMKSKISACKANALLFNRQWWASWIYNKKKRKKGKEKTSKLYQIPEFCWENIQRQIAPMLKAYAVQQCKQWKVGNQWNKITFCSCVDSVLPRTWDSIHVLLHYLVELFSCTDMYIVIRL